MNPRYLDAVAAVMDGGIGGSVYPRYMDFSQPWEQKLLDILEGLKQQIIPDAYPLEYANKLSNLRFKLIAHSSYAAVAKNWVKPLARFIGSRSCVEIMAGRGMLSKALRNEGVDIIATDAFSLSYGKFMEQPLWCPVERLDAVDSVTKYAPRCDFVICSWPPYEDPIARLALERMREVNSNCTMVYIGEPEGGCTADDSFFKTANFVEDPIFEQARKAFKPWFCIHDSLFLIK